MILSHTRTFGSLSTLQLDDPLTRILGYCQHLCQFNDIDIEIPLCGNDGNSLSRIFGKNYVKVMVLLSTK